VEFHHGGKTYIVELVIEEASIADDESEQNVNGDDQLD
jgi:hypothetical protein